MPLRLELDREYTIYKDRLYPKRSSSAHPFRYNVAIGIGGNIGDVKRRFNHLWHYINRLSYMKIIESGVILHNPPFGFLKQNYFDNSVIVVATSLEPRAFLRRLHMIESHFGRERAFENSPRTLDLDIIFFDNRNIKTKDLIVPHKDYKSRASVMIPLRSLRYLKKWRPNENFNI